MRSFWVFAMLPALLWAGSLGHFSVGATIQAHSFYTANGVRNAETVQVRAQVSEKDIINGHVKVPSAIRLRGIHSNLPRILKFRFKRWVLFAGGEEQDDFRFDFSQVEQGSGSLTPRRELAAVSFGAQTATGKHGVRDGNFDVDVSLPVDGEGLYIAEFLLILE